MSTKQTDIPTDRPTNLQLIILLPSYYRGENIRHQQQQQEEKNVNKGGENNKKPK